jgi:hypothetical protein
MLALFTENSIKNLKKVFFAEIFLLLIEFSAKNLKKKVFLLKFWH